MKMSMTDMTVKEFLSELASAAPTPGGGGAAALAGAVGASLGTMVGSLTVGKKKYAGVEEEIKSLMLRSSELSGRLAECMDRDAEAFAPLSAAYGIPKDEPGRDETLEKCLREAAAAPLEIMELVCEAIDLLREFAEKGSRLVISDAATGAALCRGALEGAAVNVKVNTGLMKDRGYAEAIDAGVDAMLREYRSRADAIYGAVAAAL